MNKVHILLLILLLLLGKEGFAQTIDAAFIAKHTYTDLSEALKNPDDVYGLDLRLKELKAFPMEILQLKNLRVLDLGWSDKNKNGRVEYDEVTNKVKYLPEEIGVLKELSFLSLSGNQIKTIPKEIGNLRKLKFLSLYGNELSDLPKEIGDLQNLETFYCSYNKLGKLPKEIGNLASLKYFNFSHNDINILPASIGNLKNLDTLDCSDNELTEFLSEISQLVGLQYLDYSNNEVSRLPSEIGQLRNLKRIRLYNNPIETVSPEVFSFLRELKYGRSSEVSAYIVDYEAAEKDKANKRTQKLQFYVILIVSIGFFIAIFFVIYVRKLQKKERQAKKELQAQKNKLETQKAVIVVKNQKLQNQHVELQEKTQELEALSEELRQQNEAVTAQKQALEEMQDTKDVMISAVNHDLRNPLNPILNYSQANYPEKPEKRLAMIHERANAMFKLIGDIMDIYRADKLQITATINSPHRAVEEAIKAISEAKNDLPRIINEVDPQLQAKFEYKYIERVFENLLSNAIKYSEPAESGGKISFWNKMADNGNIILGITDNGQGIPEDKFKEIFEPFTNPNAKSIGSAKSVGMGLTFCKTIIEAHESEIHVESEVDKGTTFWFELPLAVQEETKAEKQLEVNENFVLSEVHKEYLMAFVNRMKGYELYEVAEISEILAEIDRKDPNILGWKQAVQNAIDEYEEEVYAELVAQIS